MQIRLPGSPNNYEDLREFAPHFIESMDTILRMEAETTDPVELPTCLGLRSRLEFKSDEDWREYLSQRDDYGLTHRELYLRVLLTYAVSDQGADIPGVRIFMRHFINSCYHDERRLFHEPQLIGDPVIINHARHGADFAFEQRSEIWGKTGGRSASTYSVFTVDNVRGKPSANWYVNSRIAPPLSLPYQIEGGLTQLLSQGRNRDEIRDILRQDTTHGLFYTIGDKALDLFVKWVYGTMNLLSGLTSFDPLDVPVPMDQRIGKVLMRSGFMDEFYNLTSCVESGRFLLEGPGRPAAKLSDGQPPSDRVFLRVTDWRRHGRIPFDDLKVILNEYRSPVHRGGILPPQIALSALMRLIDAETKYRLLPHELDDRLMVIANNCHDREPDCENCPIKDSCQANNDSSRIFLKLYYT